MLILGTCPGQRDQHIQSMPAVSRNGKEEDLGARAGVGEQGGGGMPERVRPCWPGKGLWFHSMLEGKSIQGFIHCSK